MSHSKNAARRVMAGHLTNLYAGMIPLEAAVRNIKGVSSYARTEDVQDLELAAMAAELARQLEEGLEPALVLPEIGVAVYPGETAPEEVQAAVAEVIAADVSGMVTTEPEAGSVAEEDLEPLGEGFGIPADAAPAAEAEPAPADELGAQEEGSAEPSSEPDAGAPPAGGSELAPEPPAAG